MGRQTVKTAATRPRRSSTPAPRGANGRSLKYHVVRAQPRQTPCRRPHCPSTCGPAIPSVTPPRERPGTRSPWRGGAACAVPARTSATIATSLPTCGTAWRIGRMPEVNLHEVSFDGPDDDDPPGFRSRSARVGASLGAEKLGATVYALPPGEAICPYHYEYPNEEWLIVLDGDPTLRTPAGERTLRAGDVVCFPVGPEGAHSVRGGSTTAHV